jgi:hypothetical protein
MFQELMDKFSNAELIQRFLCDLNLATEQWPKMLFFTKKPGPQTVICLKEPQVPLGKPLKLGGTGELEGASGRQDDGGMCPEGEGR